MDQEGEMQSDVLCEQFPQVECFVRNLTYYRSIGEASLPNEDQDFWEEVSNAFLGAATLAWYNVFGYCGSHVYWSKLIENMPKKVNQDYKNRFYELTDLNEDAYQKCQNNIKTLRDKYIAHRDRNWQKHNYTLSNFENALKISDGYECWVNALLHKESSPQMEPLANIIQSAKGEVKHVLYVLSSQKR